MPHQFEAPGVHTKQRNNTFQGPRCQWYDMVRPLARHQLHKLSKVLTVSMASSTGKTFAFALWIDQMDANRVVIQLFELGGFGVLRTFLLSKSSC